MGSEHVLALTATGDIWGWGNNSDNQLGLGHMPAVRTPQLISLLADKSIKQVRDTIGRVPTLGVFFCLVWQMVINRGFRLESAMLMLKINKLYAITNKFCSQILFADKPQPS